MYEASGANNTKRSEIRVSGTLCVLSNNSDSFARLDYLSSSIEHSGNTAVTCAPTVKSRSIPRRGSRSLHVTSTRLRRLFHTDYNTISFRRQIYLNDYRNISDRRMSSKLHLSRQKDGANPHAGRADAATSHRCVYVGTSRTEASIKPEDFTVETTVANETLRNSTIHVKDKFTDAALSGPRAEDFEFSDLDLTKSIASHCFSKGTQLCEGTRSTLRDDGMRDTVIT